MIRLLLLLLLAAGVHAQPKDRAPPAARFPFDADRAKALQADWADHLGAPRAVTNSVGMARPYPGLRRDFPRLPRCGVSGHR